MVCGVTMKESKVLILFIFLVPSGDALCLEPESKVLRTVRQVVTLEQRSPETEKCSSFPSSVGENIFPGMKVCDKTG